MARRFSDSDNKLDNNKGLLHDAVMSDNFETVKNVLLEKQDIISKSDNKLDNNKGLLHDAVMSGDFEKVKNLLSVEQDIIAETDYDPDVYIRILKYSIFRTQNEVWGRAAKSILTKAIESDNKDFQDDVLSAIEKSVDDRCFYTCDPSVKSALIIGALNLAISNEKETTVLKLIKYVLQEKGDQDQLFAINYAKELKEDTLREIIIEGLYQDKFAQYSDTAQSELICAIAALVKEGADKDLTLNKKERKIINLSQEYDARHKKIKSLEVILGVSVAFALGAILPMIFAPSLPIVATFVSFSALCIITAAAANAWIEVLSVKNKDVMAKIIDKEVSSQEMNTADNNVKDKDRLSRTSQDLNNDELSFLRSKLRFRSESESATVSDNTKSVNTKDDGRRNNNDQSLSSSNVVSNRIDIEGLFSQRRPGKQ